MRSVFSSVIRWRFLAMGTLLLGLSGTAKVDLALGKVEVVLKDLKAVSHAGANGQNVLGYSAWLVNSENALGKLNLGLVLLKADGILSVPSPDCPRESNRPWLQYGRCC